MNFYPERVTALAFLAVGYLTPFFDADYTKTLALTKQIFGYEVRAVLLMLNIMPYLISIPSQTYGYWTFFSEDGADQIIENHVSNYLPS